MRLPTFLILGAMRSGTSSLAAYLSALDEVFVPPEKELYYFSDEKIHARGLDWYASKFAASTDEVAIGEATPHYLLAAYAPARIAGVLPDVKLIAMLRDPSERAWSHYWLNRMWKTERRDFMAALHDEWNGLPDQPGYLRAGLYYEQLQRYSEHFPRERLHAVLFEDFTKDLPDTFAGVCEFLGLEEVRPPANLGTPVNYLTRVRSRRLWRALRELRHLDGRAQRIVRAIDDWNFDMYLPIARPPIPPQWRERLVEFYRPHTEPLADFLGRDLTRWCTQS
jgi:hypothetical protein